jgi:hypothetical protein
MKNAHLGTLEVSRIGLGAMTMAGIDSSPANVKAAIEGSLKPAGTAIMEGADMGQAKTWTAFDVHVSVVAATLDRRREHPADRRPTGRQLSGGSLGVRDTAHG